MDPGTVLFIPDGTILKRIFVMSHVARPLFFIHCQSSFTPLLFPDNQNNSLTLQDDAEKFSDNARTINMALFQNKKNQLKQRRISNVPTYANSRLDAKLSIFTLSTPANSAFTNVTHGFRKESLYVFRVLHPFFLCNVVPFFLKKRAIGYSQKAVAAAS